MQNGELFPAKSAVVCMIMIIQLVSTLHYILSLNCQKGMKLHKSLFLTNHHFSGAREREMRWLRLGGLRVICFGIH